MTRKIAVLATVLAAALGASPARAVVPQVMTYSGYLKTSAGAPVTTATGLSFRLYTASTGGVPVWAETLSVTPSTDGWFSAVLGTVTPLPFASLSGELYLGIEVASEGEFPQRARLTPSYAAISVDWSGIGNKPGACTGGLFLTGFDPTGAAVCATPPTGGGGISSVTGAAGGFITATTTSRAVSLSVTGCGTAGRIMQWNGTAWACVDAPFGGKTLALRPELNDYTAGTGVATLGLIACGPAGKMLEWNGTSWVCVNTPTGGAGAVSSVGATAPIVVNGTAANPVLALTNICAVGQILKWNGTAWACANDLDTVGVGTVTNVAPAATAGNPITVANGSSTPTIDLPPAGAAASGYLRSSDWTTFNAKLTPPACAVNQIMKWDGAAWSCAADAVNAGTVTGVTATAPVVSSGGAAPVISMPVAGSAADGYLSAGDWRTFAGKVTAPAVACTDGQVLKWNAVSGAFVCAADNTNAGTVTGVTAAAPLTSSGGTAPQISMPQATNVASGWLSSADWNTFNNKIGTVTVSSPLGSSSGGGNASISLSGCATAGQELMWNGTSWVCSDFGLPLQVLGRTSTAPTLFMPQANAINDGFLAGGDWARFDAKVSGIAPGAGITVDGVTDPRNPAVAISFPASGAKNGTATQPARADHEHGKATITASFANTSDTVSGGSINKGDGAAILTTTSGVASVVEMKNVSSSFALGLPVTGSTLSFQANASSVTDTTQSFYVFFGGAVGTGSQTGGFGFRITGNGAGGRTVTGFTMGASSNIAGSTAAASLGSGVHGFFAVNRGSVVDFYVDGAFIGAGSTAAMNTVVFQTYTVRLEQAATAGSCQATVSFLTLTVPAL